MSRDGKMERTLRIRMRDTLYEKKLEEAIRAGVVLPDYLVRVMKEGVEHWTPSKRFEEKVKKYKVMQTEKAFTERYGL